MNMKAMMHFQMLTKVAAGKRRGSQKPTRTTNHAKYNNGASQRKLRTHLDDYLWPMTRAIHHGGSMVLDGVLVTTRIHLRALVTTLQVLSRGCNVKNT